MSSGSAELAAEAIRLVRVASEAGVPLRLFGGTAVWVRCPSARLPPLARGYADIDFVSRAKARQEVTRLFESNGYAPEKLFNALHGAARLIFADAGTGRPVDVILDRFAMCHEIDLRDRLELEEPTLPLADLLLTKLQIVELNEKDLLDILALLVDHPVGTTDTTSIDVSRILAVTSDDWGLEHTIRRTLGQAREIAASLGLPPEACDVVRERADAIVAALEEAPKSLRWRARARLGERIRWYSLPEEAHR